MTDVVPLGEIADIIGGGTPSRLVSAFWNGPIPWATVKDFKATALDSTLESITLKGVDSSATNVIPAGAVIVPTRMAVGKAAINSVDLAINQDLKAILPSKNVDQRFLLYFLLSQANYLQGRAQGATVKGIKINLLRSLPFPRIPLDEQRRIAKILDKADALRRKLQEWLLLADVFLKSTFLEFFGDPVSNPRGWPIASVDDLGAVQGGLQVSRKRDSLPMRRAYLRVANVFRDKLVLSEIKEIGLTEAEFSRTKLHSGDVLIVEGHGNPNEIGRTCVWDGSISDCVHQNHLIRFRADKSSVSPVYFSRLLNSQGGRLQLIASARTTSGLNTISTTKVKGLRIPLPPIDKQHEFESFVEHQEQMVMEVFRVREEAKRLFSSLSQRAFQGEL